MAHDTLLGACRHLCVEETWHQTSLHQYDPCFQAQQWQHRVVGMLFCNGVRRLVRTEGKIYINPYWRSFCEEVAMSDSCEGLYSTIQWPQVKHMEWFTPSIISWETKKCLYTDTSVQPLQAWAVQGEWRKLETEECKLVWSFPRKTVIAAKATLTITLVKSLISRKNVILFYYFPINVYNILKITFACHCLVFKCTVFM